jgi:hypothetical protein
MWTLERNGRKARRLQQILRGMAQRCIVVYDRDQRLSGHLELLMRISAIA